MSIWTGLRWTFVQYGTCQHVHVNEKIHTVSYSSIWTRVRWNSVQKHHVSLWTRFRWKYEQHATRQYGYVYAEDLYGMPRVNTGTCRIKICTVPTSQYGNVSDKLWYSTNMCQHWHASDENLYIFPYVSSHKCRIQICNHPTIGFQNTMRFQKSTLQLNFNTCGARFCTVWRISI